MSRKNTICGIFTLLAAALKIIASKNNPQKSGGLLMKSSEIMPYGLYSAYFVLIVFS
jgi:hypothetical protein